MAPATRTRRPTRAAVRRRRLTALVVLAAIVAGGIAVISAAGGAGRPLGPGHPRTPLVGAPAPVRSTTVRTATTHTVAATGSGTRAVHPPRRLGPFGVAETVMRIVDPTRTVTFRNGETEPRTLVTYVRYPTARGAGPFPLIVFGHGFAETPGLYAQLLQAWAQAGFVVAAPLYPLANPNAPDGPLESDLPNQPADDRLVITRVLAASAAASSPLHGLVNPRQIAVAGQSDGGDTALAVGYDPPYRDPRVGAVIVLSGGEIPFLPAFQIAPGGPPLLATQGSDDPINPPSATDAFFDSAPPPKFLLWLPGANHLPPYSTEQPQLQTVARVSILFLRHYLEHVPGALRRMAAAGNRPGIATLTSDP